MNISMKDKNNLIRKLIEKLNNKNKSILIFKN